MKFGLARGSTFQSTPSGDYLRSFQMGENKVRFLEELQEWLPYYEHFTLDGQGFPCTQNTSTCPGCTDEDEAVSRRSRKYATFIYVPAVNQTFPWKVPITVSDNMHRRAEQNGGTICNRDYVVIRSGKALKTKYDVDAEERYSLNIEELRRKAGIADAEEVLHAMYKAVWGQVPQSEEDEKDEEIPQALRLKSDVIKDTDLSEQQLRALSFNDLTKLWENEGFEGYDDDWSKNELVEAILKQADS
jgi:hypothetical protein